METRKEQESLNEQLFSAIAKNESSKIEQLIKDGANPGAVKINRRVIEAAAELKYWDCVKAIAQAAPQTHGKDEYKYGNALLEAVKASHKSTIECLLKAGASISWYSTTDGNFCLHAAIKNKATDIITLLLNHKANLAEVNKANQTPLEYAASLEYWDIVDFIIQEMLGKDTFENNHDEYKIGAVLLDALKSNQDKANIERLLRAGASTSWYSMSDKNHVLHWAVKNKTPGIIWLLINYKANLADVNKANLTPIEFAAHLGDWDSVEVIAKAAKTNETDTYKYGKVLLLAIQQHRLRVAEILLKANTPLNIDEGNHLHEAIFKNNSAMISLLLRYGAKLADKNEKGETAFELACTHEKWVAADTLLQDKTFKLANHSKAGIAFLYAIRAGQLEIAENLYAQGVQTTQWTKEDGSTSLHWAVMKWKDLSNNARVISFVMEHGGNQAAMNKMGETPIELACKMGLWNCAQLLVELELKQHNPPRITALHYNKALQHAVRLGNYSIVKLLLEQHTPCDEWNSEQGNIVLFSALNNSKNNRETIALLLEQGADPTVKNKDEKSHLDLAKDQNHPCRDLLEEYSQKRLLAKSASLFSTEKSAASPGISTAELDKLRQEADELYQSICDNTFTGEKLPKAINRLLNYNRTILENAKINLQHQRDNLKKTNPTTANYLTHTVHKLGKISSLITTINTLLNYPGKPISVKLWQDLPNIEVKDVKDFLERKDRIIHYYKNQVKNYLVQLDKKTNKIWQVQDWLGRWVDGEPNHIKEIKKQLINLPQLSIRDISIRYCNILNILDDVKPYYRRHPATNRFYQFSLQDARVVGFSETIDVPIASYSFIQPIEPLTPLQTVVQPFATLQANNPLLTVSPPSNQLSYTGLYPILEGVTPPIINQLPEPPSYEYHMFKTTVNQDQAMHVAESSLYPFTAINVQMQPLADVSLPLFDNEPTSPAIQATTALKTDEITDSNNINHLVATEFSDIFPKVPQHVLPKLSLYAQENKIPPANKSEEKISLLLEI